MEVKVKLKLPDASAHQKVAKLLAPFHQVTHLQENVFFDGTAGELSSKRAVLRLRFYDGDSRCVVSLKGKAVLVDGISRVEEVEEDIDVALGRACVGEPWRLAAVDCGLMKNILVEYGCKGFVCLGGFRNVRGVFYWKGLKVELWETQYDFGISYEIECETADPEGVRKLLEDFLSANDVPFSHAVMSKFPVFRFSNQIREMLAMTQVDHPDSKNASIKSTLESLLPPKDGSWLQDDILEPQIITNLFLCCAALASADGDAGSMMSWITTDLSIVAAKTIAELAEAVYSDPDQSLLKVGGQSNILYDVKALDLTNIGWDKKLVLELMPVVLPMLKDAIKSSCSGSKEDELDMSFTSVPVSSAIIAAHQMRWCLTQVKHPYIGPLCALVIPCALTTLDHWSPEVKAQAMKVFIHLARNLNSTELCWYKDVILDAVCRNLAGSDQLWRFLVEMAVTLVTCMEGRNPRAYWYGQILNEMLGVLERHSEDKERRIIWLQFIEPQFEAMGLVIVAYFRRLFPLFFYWLHAKDDTTVILALRRILTIAKLTWMRSTLYLERLLDELIFAYKESWERKSGPDIRTSVVQVLSVLQLSKGLQFEAAWRKYKDDSILNSLLIPKREDETGVTTIS